MGLLDPLFDIFRPKIQHSKPAIRKKALDDIFDQDELVQIAISDSDLGVSEKAITKITDERLLAYVAKKTAFHVDVAVSRIADREILLSLVKERYFFIRQEAIKKFPDSDQDIFFSCACNDPMAEVQTVALNRIEDIAKLRQIMKATTFEKVRELAKARILTLEENDISKNADQEQLKKIALDEHRKELHPAALKHISDKGFLLEYARKHNPQDGQAEVILNRFSSPGELLNIAKDESLESGYRDLAYKRLIDEKDKAEIAISCGAWNMAYDAIDAIWDQQLLKRIAVESNSESIRAKAIKKLDDPDICNSIARSNSPRSVRLSAIEKVTDQAILAELAQNDPEADIRRAAVLKVQDAEVKQRIARNDTDEMVRQIAGLPETGTCGSCGKSVPIRTAKQKSSMGDYHTMTFYYCPGCSKDGKRHHFTGRLHGPDGQEIMVSRPGGEWG